MFRKYPTLKALRDGQVIEIDGIQFKRDPSPLQPGDLYIAERNTGPHLLTVKSIKMSDCGDPDWVVATTNDYSFDFHECVKVMEA